LSDAEIFKEIARAGLRHRRDFPKLGCCERIAFVMAGLDGRAGLVPATTLYLKDLRRGARNARV